mmetsp:Transcript_2980/g.4360  ORF Transcript_2980/g.4360 Transcript_2980/m.4360 type:complete len:316 (+) Transcript_2980:36-983(+)
MEDEELTSLDSEGPIWSDKDKKKKMIYASTPEYSKVKIVLVLLLHVIVNYVLLHTIQIIGIIIGMKTTMTILAYLSVLVMIGWALLRIPLNYEIYHDRIHINTIDQFLIPEKLNEYKIGKFIKQLTTLGKSNYIIPFNQIAAVTIKEQRLCTKHINSMLIQPNTLTTLLKQHIQIKKVKKYHKHHIMSPKKHKQEELFDLIEPVTPVMTPYTDAIENDVFTSIDESTDDDPKNHIKEESYKMLDDVDSDHHLTINTINHSNFTIMDVTGWNTQPILLSPSNLRQFTIQLSRAIDDYTSHTHGQLIPMNLPSHFQV